MQQGELSKNNKNAVAGVLLFLVTGLTITTGCASIIDEPAPLNHPNIVLILVDDLGYGDVQSNFPDGKIHTPNIDRLAAEGIRFTDAHSGAAVCSPTRYGLLTGQHFSRQNWDRIRYQTGVSMIDEDRLTVSEFLQEQGYHTGAFGKWHLGQTWYDKQGAPTGGPGPDTDWSRSMTGGALDHGFDTFFGVAFTHAHYLQALISDRLVTEIPTLEGERGVPKAAGYEPWHAMPASTEKALEYIEWNERERPNQPFFLYYATAAIHLPLVPSPEFKGKSEVGIYGDFVMQTDAAVGKIIAKLQELGIRNDTLLIVTSDNGSPGIAGNGSVRKYPFEGVKRRYKHNMNGDWRGYKGTAWEGGHRVPFIASWPGHIEPGATSDQLITLEDFMATSAAITGGVLPRNTAEDSYNILPYLDGSHSGPPIREYAVLSTFNGDSVLRKGKWVLTFFLGSGGQWRKNLVPEKGGPRGQLYDLEADPQQQNNVWLEHPEVVAELTDFYKKHVERGRSFNVER